MDYMTMIDNDSVKSDDTDYLLSHRAATFTRTKDVTGNNSTSNSSRTEDYINSLDDFEHFSTSNHSHNFEVNAASNLSISSIRNSFESNSSLNKSPGTTKKVSFHVDSPDVKGDYHERKSPRLTIISENQKVSPKNIKIRKEPDLIDDKVRQGQEILAKLLSNSKSPTDATNSSSFQPSGPSPYESKLININNMNPSSKYKLIDFTEEKNVTADRAEVFPDQSLKEKPANSNHNLLGGNDGISKYRFSSKERESSIISDEKLSTFSTNLDVLDEKQYSNIFDSYKNDLVNGKTVNERNSTPKQNMLTQHIFQEDEKENKDPMTTQVVPTNSLMSYMDSPNINDNYLYDNEIKRLKEEIKFLEESSAVKLDILKQETERKLTSLTDSIEILKKQKDNLTEHVNQLKEALSKKNKKCLDYQDTIHEKTREIQKMMNSDDIERQNLQHEISQLQSREKALDRQVDNMQEALHVQQGQIQDLEESVINEKKQNQNIFKSKDDEIELLRKSIISLRDKLATGIESQSEETKERENQLLNDVNVLKQELRLAKQSSEIIKKDYATQYDGLLKENAKKLQKQIDKYKNMNHDKQNQVNTLEIENQELKLAVENLKTDLSNANKLTSSNSLLAIRDDDIIKLQKTIEEWRSRWKLENESKEKLKRQLTLDHEKYKSNIEVLKSRNTKLKEQLAELRSQIKDLENANAQKETSNDIVEALKKQLAMKERNERSIALELIEESTKMDVISGFSTDANSNGDFHSAGVVTTANDKSEEGQREMLSEVLEIFKVHSEYFRNYSVTLQHQLNEIPSVNQSDQSFTTSSPVNTQTSAKLLRHLQNRVQQLRKENATLRQDIRQDTIDGGHSTQDSSFSLPPEIIEKRVEDLELSLQKCELESQKNMNLVYQKNSEINKLQKMLSQTTKENLRLEKAYAMLQHQSVLKDQTHDIDQLEEIVTKDMISFPSSHSKALGPNYHGTFIQKFSFPLDYVTWEVEYPSYYPVDYTAVSVMSNPVWADNDIRYTREKLRFNVIDGKVDRRSHMGMYKIIDGIPRNPIGRTGMTGRGLLGRWGPNHAADPIVTRWARDMKGNKLYKDDRPIMEFVAIKRVDTSQWAIPGGMVDPGEKLSATLKREFGEEALNSLELSGKRKEEIKSLTEELFRQGTVIYKGYVDDPRNTDNSWMETIAVNFHDDSGNSTATVALNAGDDAKAVRWLSINSLLDLYASHYDFIKHTCRLHDAYFME